MGGNYCVIKTNCGWRLNSPALSLDILSLFHSLPLSHSSRCLIFILIMNIFFFCFYYFTTQQRATTDDDDYTSSDADCGNFFFFSSLLDIRLKRLMGGPTERMLNVFFSYFFFLVSWILVDFFCMFSVCQTVSSKFLRVCGLIGVKRVFMKLRRQNGASNYELYEILRLSFYEFGVRSYIYLKFMVLRL